MATKEQIFGILAAASAPMSRSVIGEKLGESYRRFQTQLDRWVGQELLEDTGEHNYQLTDKGREEALQEEPGDTGEGEEPVPGKEPEPTQATAGTTEYQQFYKFGRNVGVVPANLIKVTCDHVWNGGDYRNLAWVAKALQEMGIQRDLANRWFYAWHSHLKLPLPLDLPADFLPTEAKKAQEEKETAKKEGAGKRDYILSPDDVPTFVGEGNGDLDYKDAMDLARIRTARKKDTVASSPGSMAEEITKIFKAFKEAVGEEKAAGKSYVIKPGEEGYVVEELDPSKPMIIPQREAAKAATSFVVKPDGQVEEVQQGKPIVIMQEAVKVAQSGTVHYIVDRATGKVEEVASNQPIIIQAAAPPQYQSTPIQVKDKDGNPMVLDINTYIKLEEHRDKQRRDDESHETKMDIAKAFKDLLKNAQTALSNMGEED